MKRSIRRTLSCILAAAFVLLSMPVPGGSAEGEGETLPAIVGVDEDTDESERVNYEEAAANDHCILYADMEKGLFALKSRESGDIWYSTPNDSLQDEYTSGSERWGIRSQLVISYLFKEDILSSTEISRASSQLGCLQNGAVTVKKLPDGIRVLYEFSELGVTIPVEYRLRGASLAASIDIAGIDEGEECLLTDINLLPSFGAGNWEAEGQLLIPDGCGALVDFNNGVECTPYEALIYGEDKVIVEELDDTRVEAIRLPVFATLMKNKALMGIVTKGDGSAAIRALNGNADCGYNAVSSKLKLRSLENLMMFKRQTNRRSIGRLTENLDGVDTYEVLYTPIRGETVSYVHIANAYRDYLVAEKNLTARPQTPSLAVDLYGSMDVKAAFLGIEYSKQQSLTTFAQAQEILDALTEKGAGALAVRYLGWSRDGLLNKSLPSKAKPLSNLGGAKGFEALKAYIGSGANALYPDVDFMQYRSGRDRDAVKTSFNEVSYHTERLRSVFSARLGLTPIRLLTPQNLAPAAQKYLASYKKQGLGAISLSTLGDLIYSNSSTKNGFHRYHFPEQAEKVLAAFRDAGLDIALEQANAYAAPYAARIYNAPTVCSGYDMFDEEIPFYQIVFHGYITMTVAPMAQSIDARMNLLKAVESGSELLYGGMYEDASAVTGTRYDHLYSTQYGLWLDDAAETAARYRPLLEKVYKQTITAHQQLSPDVMMTTFEDGTQVIVNYSRAKATVNGISIEALDYAVTEGAAA